MVNEMADKDFLDFVACDGLGYVILDGGLIDKISDKKMKAKVKRAHSLLNEIDSWVENHPDYEVM